MKQRVGLLITLFSFGFLAQACGTTRYVVMPPPQASYPTTPVRIQSSIEQASRSAAECQALARQQTGYEPVKDTIVGGVVGGAVGAAAGAAVGVATGGDPGKGAAIGAIAGGVVGGVAGYTKSRESYEQAYASCMSARGYSMSGSVVVVRSTMPWHPWSVVVVPEGSNCRQRYGNYYDDPRTGVPHWRPIPGQYICRQLNGTDIIVTVTP